MLRRRLALLPLLLLGAPGGESVSEGAAPRIELYTMGKGDELFTMFGHTALCVVGSEYPGGGLCYNYGTSDFSRPIGLAWDVVRGRAEFWVSVTDLPSMVLGFQYQDRTIYRQVLPLPEHRALALAHRLAVDASPENRVYVYNHYLDNCSTRPRDLIEEATKGALGPLDFADGATYRDYAVEGLGSFSWGLVPASDFVMGRWVDQEISTYEAMFIPSVLSRGVTLALGAEPEVVSRRQAPEPRADVGRARRITWWGVVGLLLALGFVARGGARKAFAVGPWLLSALGSILVFAAAVSNLPELQGNELLAVFVPLDFLLIARSRTVAASYAGLRLGALALVALLALLGVFIQPLWPFWVLATGVVLLAVLRLRAAPQRAPSAA